MLCFWRAVLVIGALVVLNAALGALDLLDDIITDPLGWFW
jgi:hypothetical protein